MQLFCIARTKKNNMQQQGQRSDTTIFMIWGIAGIRVPRAPASSHREAAKIDGVKNDENHDNNMRRVRRAQLVARDAR